MSTAMKPWKSLSIALLLFGLLAGALSGGASAATLTVTSPTKDPYSYIPGESMTATFGGLSTTTAYDMRVTYTNGTAILELLNQTSASGTLTWTFNIPANFDGSYYVRGYLNGSAGAMNTRSFQVHLFSISANLDHPVYLPGDHVTVYYYTQRLEDQRPLDAGHGRWAMSVVRDNGTGTATENLGNSISAPQGSFVVELPATTHPAYYDLTITYNDTTDAHSQSYDITVEVGTYNLVVSLDRSPANYAPGDSVVVTVRGTTSWGSSEPTNGVSIASKVQTYDAGNATWNTESAYTIPTQTTTLQGTASFIVTLQTGIADATQMRVLVTGTRSGTPQEASAAFTVRSNTGLTIALALDQTIYTPGQTITATLSFITSNATLVNGAMYQWTIENGDTSATLLYDYSAGTPTGAVKTFQIPTGYSGSINVYVTVYTPDDRTYSRSQTATVFSSALLVVTSKQLYQPGDTITVTTTLVTDRTCADGEPRFVWLLTPGSTGEPIKNGSATPGSKSYSFSFQIPTPADDSYTVSTSAACGGVVEKDSKSLSREKYLALQITVPDKSYKPGDTVRVHWKIVPVGGATPPPVSTITLYLGGYPYFVAGSGRSYEVQGLEGDVDYTIPSSTSPTADLTITALGGAGAQTSTVVAVRPSAGASPASSAANAATWGLVIAVLALFLGVLALMRRPHAAGEHMDSPRRSSFSEMKPEQASKDEPKKDDKKADEPPKSL
jgi:hypothetical protein